MGSEGSQKFLIPGKNKKTHDGRTRQTLTRKKVPVFMKPTPLVRDRMINPKAQAFLMDERNHCDGKTMVIDPSKLISPPCPGGCLATIAECYLVQRNGLDWYCLAGNCKENSILRRIRRDRLHCHWSPACGGPLRLYKPGEL